jgi:hypothetical protein
LVQRYKLGSINPSPKLSCCDIALRIASCTSNE